MLSSRERVQKAINHIQPDKVPVDLGSFTATGIAAITCNKVSKQLTGKNTAPRLYDFMQQLAYPDEEMFKSFKIDTIDPGQVFLKSGSDWREFVIPYDGTKCMIPKYLDKLYDIVIDEKETVYFKHKDGTIIGRMPKSSRVVDQEYWPYRDLEEIPQNFDFGEVFSKHLWMIPQPLSIEKMADKDGEKKVYEKIKDLYKTKEYSIIYNFGGNIFDIGFTLRGLDIFLIDTYKDRKGTLRLVESLCERSLAALDNVFKTIGKYIDVLIFYDDLAYQTDLFIPPEMYREIFKPFHKKMWDFVHKNSDCKVLLHCCGSAYKLIPDFIDAGVDILNPVQINSANMEPAKIKKEFGKDISFWGGGCDTMTLTTKGPKEVSEEVKRNVEIFSKDGGYVFSSIHNITAEVAPENVIAMFEAANNF